LLRDPRDIVIANPALKPDFAQAPVRTYQTRTTKAGDVEARVYRSVDGSIEYTLFIDKKNHAWVADAYPVSREINEFGIPKAGVDFDGLTAPLYEYNTQIATKYGGRAGHGYGYNWKYVREIPVIQDFYKSTGIPMPEM
jgi:hypothetical protein